MSTPPFTFSRVTLAGPLHTLTEVKAHLRITDTANDADVQQKYDAAEERILAELGPAGDASWTPATAPKGVKQAMLLLTTNFYEHRGDDVSQQRPDQDFIWQQIRNLLSMYRDPTVA